MVAVRSLLGAQACACAAVVARRRHATELERLVVAQELERLAIDEGDQPAIDSDQPILAQSRQHAVEMRNAEAEGVAQNFLREGQVERVRACSSHGAQTCVQLDQDMGKPLG